ncbi:MAG: response regulator [Flavisolibacter sp.]
MTKAVGPRNIVFYADDDTDDLELVQDAFRRYTQNVEVITAPDGQQALHYFRLLQKHDPLPCLVILDINMPVLNGKEVLRHLRSMEGFEALPVVLFTTSSLPQDLLFAEKYNAGLVTKPIDATQMEVITEMFISHCTDEIRKNIRR